MNSDIVIIFIFFTILISMQYSLNKILYELKDIKKLIARNRGKLNE
ncbi:hypothetical protein [Gottschalkia acidurici]|nr:hypothetical protein [Gottschalkia acidurici]